MSATNSGKPELGENQQISRRSDEVRSEAEHLLRSWAERTGFPLDELNRLRARRAAAPRGIPDAQAPASAFVPHGEDVVLREMLERERELLRSLSPPVAVIKLDHPDSIELVIDRDPVSFFEKDIQPFSSIARLVVDVGSLPHSDSPTVTATYRWSNPGPNLALVNIGTLLRIRGRYDIWANAGFFDGNTNKLDVSARLSVAIDGQQIPVGGNIFQTVVHDEASAGSIFGSGDDHVGNSVVSAVGLGADMIIVPAGTEASFIIDFTTSCRLDADASLGDEVKVDFGSLTSSGLSRIQYPFLNVEILAN